MISIIILLSNFAKYYINLGNKSSQTREQVFENYEEYFEET